MEDPISYSLSDFTIFSSLSLRSPSSFFSIRHSSSPIYLSLLCSRSLLPPSVFSFWDGTLGLSGANAVRLSIRSVARGLTLPPSSRSSVFALLPIGSLVLCFSPSYLCLYFALLSICCLFLGGAQLDVLALPRSRSPPLVLSILVSFFWKDCEICVICRYPSCPGG